MCVTLQSFLLDDVVKYKKQLRDLVANSMSHPGIGLKCLNIHMAFELAVH